MSQHLDTRYQRFISLRRLQVAAFEWTVICPFLIVERKPVFFYSRYGMRWGIFRYRCNAV